MVKLDGNIDMSDGSIPDAIELQRIYDLSKIESEMYVMKLQGSKYQEIAEFHNVSLQAVKQTMHNAMRKIKDRDTMNVIVVYDSRDPLTKRSTAEMVLRILEKDLESGKFYIGTHTMLLADVPNVLGDMEFMKKSVLPFCDIIANTPYEAKTKADRFYQTYLDKGGVKGKMGVGIMQHIFTQFRIKYDIY